jgi:hypothetical protein
MSGINGIVCVRCHHFNDVREFIRPLYKNQYLKRCADCRDVSTRNCEKRKLNLGDYKFTLLNGKAIPL